jgi:alpha-L-fucosidase
VLLDVGPTEDGQITPVQQERLLGLGRWTHKHAEAIYGSVAGLPAGLFYGSSTLSKDRETLYLHQFDIPREYVNARGIRNAVKRVSVLGTGEELSFKKAATMEWTGVPGDLEIQIPEGFLPDPDATVYKVDLEGPLELLMTKGRS